jgi:glucose-6-phosphate 1-epimerase
MNAAGAFMTTWGQLPAVLLRSPSGAQAILTLYGAHVVSWQPEGRAEHLFCSAQSARDGSKAIRGGVPVIFPQFAERGAGMRHGFARVANWRLAGSNVNGDKVSLDLHLTQDDLTDQQRAGFAHRFRLVLRVTVVSDTLHIELDVDNHGDAPFLFACALHTYFAADATQATLEGLHGASYTDQAGGGTSHVQDAPLLTFERKLDRIYQCIEPLLTLRDGPRAVLLEQHGFADCVTWNPGADDARALADMADDEYRRFVCVEAAQIAPVSLAPGERWSASQYWTAE